MAKHITQIIPTIKDSMSLKPELIARFIIWERIQAAKGDVTACGQDDYETYANQELTKDQQLNELTANYKEIRETLQFLPELHEFAAIGVSQGRIVKVNGERVYKKYTAYEQIDRLRGKVYERIRWLGVHQNVPTFDFIVR